VMAESVLIKHQLLIVNRSRQRAPNLRVLDRLIAGFCSLLERGNVSDVSAFAQTGSRSKSTFHLTG